MSELRSRKSFRFMPAPVLSHHVPLRELVSGSALTGSSFGRGLYARKVLPSEADGRTESSSGAPLTSVRVAATVLRWQQPLRYLIVWQRRDLTLTWHAPWCRRCDCPGAGWRFDLESGYMSGLGFELSYARG